MMHLFVGMLLGILIGLAVGSACASLAWAKAEIRRLRKEIRYADEAHRGHLRPLLGNP